MTFNRYNSSRFWRVASALALTAALSSHADHAAAIAISEDVFVANGGDLNDVEGTITKAMKPLRRDSMAPQFLGVGQLDTLNTFDGVTWAMSYCTGTWLGDSPDGRTSYILTAHHCVLNREKTTPRQGEFNADSLTIDRETGEEIWTTRRTAEGHGTAHVTRDGRHNHPDDIAIFALPKTGTMRAPDGTPVARPRIYIGRNEFGNPVTFVGYGIWGAGDEKPRVGEADEGPLRSMGESVVEDLGYDDRLLSTKFDPTDGLRTGHWADTTDGDSGSAWWMKLGDVWTIVGVTSGSRQREDGTLDPNEAVAPRTSAYWEWIRSIYPDVLLYDYRDAASTDENTHVFDNLLLQAAHADSLGTGEVTVDGKGELWTVVDRALNGNSLVNDGLVVVKDDSRQFVNSLTGQGQLTLEGASHLDVDTPAAAVDTYAGTFDGTGALRKRGDGALRLLSRSAGFTGDTQVDAGVLAVEGSLERSKVEVKSGGTLAGSGTVGGLTAAGTVSPGAWGRPQGYETLKVAGDVVFLPGSVYRVSLDADGQASRIEARGEARLKGGTVAVSAARGDYSPSARYTILQTTGDVSGRFAGISGNFDAVTTDLAFLSPGLSYESDAVNLEFERNGVAFVDVANTSNQRATAAAVEAMGDDNPVYDALVGSTAAGARGAFGVLSGDIHASLRSALLVESQQLRSAVLGRLQMSGAARDAAPSGAPALSYAPARGGGANPLAKLPSSSVEASLGDTGATVWGKGFGSWSAFRAGRSGAERLRSDTTGFVGGLEAAADDMWRAGIAAGYARNALRTGSADATVESYSAAVYGGGRFDNTSLRLGAAYTWHDISTARAVGVRSFTDRPSSGYEARTGQVFGEIGYDIAPGPVVVEPFAGLAYVHVTTDRFAERGGAAALHGERSGKGTGFSTLGVRWAAQTPLGEQSSLHLHGLVGWRHVLGGATSSARLAFDGGQPFTVRGAPIANNSLLAEAGVDVRLRDRISIGVNYTGEMASQSWAHTVKGVFSVRF